MFMGMEEVRRGKEVTDNIGIRGLYRAYVTEAQPKTGARIRAIRNEDENARRISPLKNWDLRTPCRFFISKRHRRAPVLSRSRWTVLSEPATTVARIRKVTTSNSRSFGWSARAEGMKAIVVYNEKAGSVGTRTDGLSSESLREAFAVAGINAEIHGATGTGIDAALREAVAQRPVAVYAGGGDGTVSAAAGFLVDTDIVLGVLPLGTLNHFARDLGVPLAWRDAITVLASAPIRAVDVAEMNGRIFINNCSLGSYAEAVRRRDALRQEKGRGKWRAMIVVSWTVFRELRRLRLQIDTPEGSFALRAPFVLVANNRYTGSVLASSLRPQLDGGRLWLYTTRAHRHAALLRLMWQVLIRRIDAADELEVRSLTETTITVAGGPAPVAADGELLNMKPPLHFKIRPAALRVFAPAHPAA
jgi:diacylglycerol kinase family enzyme